MHVFLEGHGVLRALLVWSSGIRPLRAEDCQPVTGAAGSDVQLCSYINKHWNVNVICLVSRFCNFLFKPLYNALRRYS